jgi:magnesium-transporting ATPase (P-type)
MMPALATVIREGVGIEIAVASIVVGDVVSLKAGDAVITTSVN